MDQKEKEITETIVEAIFNGIPNYYDVIGIESFNFSDVFDLLRKEREYGDSDLQQEFREKVDGISDEDLKKRIETVLDVFVAAGVFIHDPDFKNEETKSPPDFGEFSPSDIAYPIRRFFITGIHPVPEGL